MALFLSVRRRHRLNEDETPLVYALVQERLRELLEDRASLEEAEALTHLTMRMDHNTPGRPAYPEPFTWGVLEAYILGQSKEEEEETFEEAEEQKEWARDYAEEMRHEPPEEDEPEERQEAWS